MRFRTIFLRVGLSVVLIGCNAGVASRAFATAAPPPLMAPSGLSITEIKITGDEFVVLQNNGTANIPDLSTYWLYAFTKTNPLAAGATNSAQQLPSAALPAGASVLLSGGGVTCGASVAAKLSLSLGDSAGALQLLATTTTGLIVPTPVDAVSWSSGTDGDISNVPKSTTDKQAAFYRVQTHAQPSAYGWQLADVAVNTSTGVANICQLQVGGNTTQIQAITDAGQLLAAVGPPATIVSAAGAPSSQTGPVLPQADVGLAAPQLTELLPNPTGTSNDDTDEFIELYNSNATAFDLGGFTLQTGTTAKHDYVFPAGTMLPPKTFTAFYSASTGLSLSNSGGQAGLLDPFGNTLTQSDVYSTAKDGQSWVLADGAWYWTTQITPNAANVVKQVVTAATVKTKTSATQNGGAVKGATTNRAGTQGTAATAAANAITTAPIHPLVLAVIAVLAVGYGVYEYRHDLANRIHELRANRATRRRVGASASRR